MPPPQGYPFDLDDPETMTFFVKYARPMDHPRRVPPGGPPRMGRGRGGPGPGGRGGGPGGPDMAGGRGGPSPGRGAGGRGGGRFGAGGPPPRDPRNY